MEDKHDQKHYSGKLRLLFVSVLLDISALVCLFVSFVTPYWIVSWPRVFSGFRRMGLWEVCFNGFIKVNDPSQKSYYGCWWIHSPELYGIRNWIMPPWFIVVQLLITICLIIDVLLVVFDVILWVVSAARDYSGMGKKRAPYGMVEASTGCCIATCVIKTAAIIIFGLAQRFDPFWLETPEINYPHFSYGLAILSAFFNLFSSIAHWVHRDIVRTDDYTNPATGKGYFVPSRPKV